MTDRRFNRRVSISTALAQQRDNEGRLILAMPGPNTICPWCEAADEATISSDNQFIIWHAPTSCCEHSRTKNQRARDTHDREMRRYAEIESAWRRKRGELIKE